MRLSDRRRADTRAFEHDGMRFTVTIAFYADGRPGEVFAHGARAGSMMNGILDDACVALSLLLQHGVEPDRLAARMGSKGDDRPASIIGAVVDRPVVGEERPLTASPRASAEPVPPRTQTN